MYREAEGRRGSERMGTDAHLLRNPSKRKSYESKCMEICMEKFLMCEWIEDRWFYAFLLEGFIRKLSELNKNMYVMLMTGNKGERFGSGFDPGDEA